MGVLQNWGSTEAERARAFACDQHLPSADVAWFRAVDVAAPPAVVFRWLCQLKAAPYSYDFIDNRGHTSPRQLTPGLDVLAVDQPIMGIFRLVEWQADRHLTMVIARAGELFGELALTYEVTPSDGGGSRLVAKLLIRHRRPKRFSLPRWFLLFGDFIMMRKQLLTLKALAELHSAGG